MMFWLCLLLPFEAEMKFASTRLPSWLPPSAPQSPTVGPWRGRKCRRWDVPRRRGRRSKAVELGIFVSQILQFWNFSSEKRLMNADWFSCEEVNLKHESISKQGRLFCIGPVRWMTCRRWPPSRLPAMWLGSKQWGRFRMWPNKKIRNDVIW